VEVKIGVRDVGREVLLESDRTPDEVAAAVEEALTKGGLLRLIDERGRMVVVPGPAIGYVEIGVSESRRVGFGAG
jgi:hypothetical protein